MLKSTQPALQVYKNSAWQYVFCHNPLYGVITTASRRKALNANLYLDYFRTKDPAAIPREYLAIDEVKIRKVVQALKGDTNIPGVEVYAEESMAARAASF